VTNFELGGGPNRFLVLYSGIQNPIPSSVFGFCSNSVSGGAFV
jgi:hypothetical protein